MLERASYPISGTDSRHTSTLGTGGPTVPSIGISFGSDTNVPAQVSVRPTLTLIQNKMIHVHHVTETCRHSMQAQKEKKPLSKQHELKIDIPYP